jgi:UDP-N-acetylmuramoyl-L-alanyl-D-glutamate--2,6-diaminopimelate ligase
MGRTSVELSDYTWVTSDNPRTENPQSIIQEILAGIPKGSAITVEPDRKKAIFGSISMAERGDIVLIAGKGHEDYQIIADSQSPTGTRKIHFDDREVATEACQLKSS